MVTIMQQHSSIRPELDGFGVIILARGGSKGIPRKNIKPFAGSSLLEISVLQFLTSGFGSIFVSTDDVEIASVASSAGAEVIERPHELSGDKATSEVAWAHSIEYLKSRGRDFEWIVAPQVTSPLREVGDIQSGITMALSGEHDSLFSASVVTDVCIWEKSSEGLNSLTYDWRNRQRRQEVIPKYLENGSFYFFRPDNLLRENNRFFGKVGAVLMEPWKSFEIDAPIDFEICEFLYRTRISSRRSEESILNEIDKRGRHE